MVGTATTGNSAGLEKAGNCTSSGRIARTQSDMGEVRISRRFRKLAMGLSLAAVVCWGAGPLRAQTAAQKALLEKAQSQEQAGHIDLAAQNVAAGSAFRSE